MLSMMNIYCLAFSKTRILHSFCLATLLMYRNTFINLGIDLAEANRVNRLLIGMKHAKLLICRGCICKIILINPSRYPPSPPPLPPFVSATPRLQHSLVLSMAAMAAVRSALLSHLRVRVESPAAPAVALSFVHIFCRRFSNEVMGSFLDKSEVADRIVTVVKNFQKVDPSKVTPNAHFQKDLGLDSLDTVEIVMALEEEFGFEIPDNEADKIDSINVAVDFIASHPQAK